MTLDAPWKSSVLVSSHPFFWRDVTLTSPFDLEIPSQNACTIYTMYFIDFYSDRVWQKQMPSFRAALFFQRFADQLRDFENQKSWSYC